MLWCKPKVLFAEVETKAPDGLGLIFDFDVEILVVEKRCCDVNYFYEFLGFEPVVNIVGEPKLDTVGEPKPLAEVNC